MMSDKEKYIITINEEQIEVTPEVYYAYYRMARQERGQEEKKQRNIVLSYDALDNEETIGEAALADVVSPSLEQLILTKEKYDLLYRAVDTLPRGDRNLIKAIFSDGMTEAQYAAMVGLTQQGVSYRLKKILSKLKMFLEFMGSF